MTRSTLSGAAITGRGHRRAGGPGRGQGSGGAVVVVVVVVGGAVVVGAVTDGAVAGGEEFWRAVTGVTDGAVAEDVDDGADRTAPAEPLVPRADDEPFAPFFTAPGVVVAVSGRVAVPGVVEA